MKSGFEYPLSYFIKKLNLHNGKFVDVGANDGVHGSMTYALEQSGWTGILVEPNPVLVEKLKRVRSSPVFQYAISSVEGNLPFYIVEGPSNLDGLSRFHYTEEFETFVKSCGGSVKESVVQVKKISCIINECSNLEKIDFLKIDVEGHEYEVLKSFDFEKFKPSLIVTEDNFKDEFKKVRYFLKTKGYEVIARDRINYWFAPKSEVKKFMYDYLHAKMRFLRWDVKRVLLRLVDKKINTGNH